MKDVDSKEKLNFLTPFDVLNEIRLGEGSVVVDYGSGPGHWAIAAGKIVGTKGTVYAFENNIEILQVVKNLAAIRRLTNIEVDEINLEKDELKIDEPADLVIISNVLHSIKNKVFMIDQASKVIKYGGKLLIVDWSSEKTLFGPHQADRLSQEKIMTMVEKAGLKFVCTVDAGWHHFGLVFTKGDKSGE